jgi:hypothetical protein
MAERLVALAVLAASGIYLWTALPLAPGTAARPGPGFFPLGVGAFAGAVAVAWVVRAFRRAPAAAGAPLPPEAQRRVLATTGLLAAFCLLLPWTGYPVAAFLFAALLLRRLGARWPGALLTGVAAAAISYYVFAILLGVPLPRGPGPG